MCIISTLVTNYSYFTLTHQVGSLTLACLVNLLVPHIPVWQEEILEKLQLENMEIICTTPELLNMVAFCSSTENTS